MGSCPDVCNVLVQVQCACGFKTKKKPCPGGDDPVCDGACERYQKSVRMQEAFGVGVGFLGWKEGVVTTAQTFPSLLSQIEQVLAQMIKDFTLYYYFPTQKLQKCEWLVMEVATGYGFICELVDERTGRGNVVIRMGKTQNGICLLKPSRLPDFRMVP